jgi:alkyl sulfatase BDS1-like metallo-beta-lactamase superfamily hydrolase
VSWGLEVANVVLNGTPYAPFESPTATDTGARSAIDDVTLGRATFSDQVASGAIAIDGSTDAFVDFLGLLDTFDFWFNIATP